MQTKPSRSTASSRTKNTTGKDGKRIATVENRFSRRRYAALLADALPRVIDKAEELERVSRLAEPLLKKGGSRTPEENALCQLLLKLIDDYQERHTIIPELAPHELCRRCWKNPASGRRICFRSLVRAAASRTPSTVSVRSARNKRNGLANTSAYRPLRSSEHNTYLQKNFFTRFAGMICVE